MLHFANVVAVCRIDWEFDIPKRSEVFDYYTLVSRKAKVTDLGKEKDICQDRGAWSKAHWSLPLYGR